MDKLSPYTFCGGFIHTNMAKGKNNKKRLLQAYSVSKSAKVGDTCICPSCGTKFVKTNYQQAFCKSECKDFYWNNVTPNKRCNRTRISPASARWLASNERNQHLFGEDAPNIVGGSGRISGITSEGYRVMDGVAYDKFDEPMYDVDVFDDTHPMDMGDAGDKD